MVNTYLKSLDGHFRKLTRTCDFIYSLCLKSAILRPFLILIKRTMHEFSIMQNMLTQLDDIAQKNHLVSIQQVTIRIGELRQCSPELLTFAFETLTETTLAKNAKLVIEFIPITIQCASCHQEFSVNNRCFICPHCQGTQLQIIHGKELILASIEGEQ